MATAWKNGHVWRLGRHVIAFLSMALILSIITSLPTVQANKRSKMKPPLIGEDMPRKNRKSDCQFGKQVYELEETWHPDLGPPFGIMYCIRCECIPVQKKKRISGRTLCRNIKNECPKPNCDEPVLLPGSCCKVCPEESLGMGPLKEDVSSNKDIDDDDKQSKDFAAILTRSDLNASSKSTVATARFNFHKRHLYFSLVTEPGLSLPLSIQFLSEEGNIVEDQELTSNDYHTATGKLCGVWRKVPRVYRQQLRDEKLLVSLIGDGDSVSLTGRIARYKGLSSEVLSALLVPESSSSCPGCGGTAAVSMASASNSLYMTVAVTGLLTKNADADAIVVRVETLETGSHPSAVIEEIVTVQKPQEINVMEIRTVLEAQEMRHLMRGQVALTAFSRRSPEIRLRGVIGPRIACDIFDSLIAGSDSSEEGAVSDPSSPKGLAWFYIGRNGIFHHHIYIQDKTSPPTSVTIETGFGKNKRRREIENLTGSLASQWINGTFRLPARDYELLYEGELYVNVVGSTESRGRIVPRIAGESHLSVRSGPVLLSAVNGTRAGLGWVNIDPQCTMHYDVNIKTLRKDQQGLTILELVDVPKIIPLGHNPSGAEFYLGTEGSSSEGDNIYLPGIRLLEEYSGDRVENSFGELSKLSLSRLRIGGAYLKVTEPKILDVPGTEFRGWLTNVRVPETCVRQLPAADMGETSGMQSLGPGMVLEPQDQNEVSQMRHCYYEEKLYEEGSQWHALHNRCTMCSCQRGRVVCDAIVCPALSCSSNAVVQAPGECCPVCGNVTAKPEPKVTARDNSSMGCSVPGDQKLHPPGSRWHPYLPPFGFSKCAICVCNPETLKAECKRLTCPPLNCPDSEAFRPDPMACCKQCPAPSTSPPSEGTALLFKDTLGEEAKEKSEADIVNSGGCRFKGDVYENGEEWHPRIQPWGEMKCINCACKDGKVKCKRKKCTRTHCPSSSTHKSSSQADECCSNCTEDNSTPVARPKKPSGRNPTTTTTTAAPPVRKAKPREDRFKSRDPKPKRPDS